GRRTPADGELDWTQPAAVLERLVRAVTIPYPGAFSFAGRRKLTVWGADVVEIGQDVAPGTVMSIDPLRIACGEGALEIRIGEAEHGLALAGSQLARDMGLAEGMRLGRPCMSLTAGRGS